KQKGDTADDVDGLCQQRLICAALAIAEDMLAKVHGPHPFDPLLQERGLPRRRFHRRTLRVHLFLRPTARTTPLCLARNHGADESCMKMLGTSARESTQGSIASKAGDRPEAA